jgi:hypothetical protein
MSNFNLSFPIDQLATAIAEKLQPYFLPQTTEQPKEEGYRTRKETAEMLKISLPTLNEYTKKRILTGYRVGVRVLYKQSEIELALVKMKFARD